MKNSFTIGFVGMTHLGLNYSVVSAEKGNKVFTMPKDLKQSKTKENRKLVDQSKIPMTPEPVNGSHKD